MIEIGDVKNIEPFQKFLNLYKIATLAGQKNIEAACLGTVSRDNNPHSRFINIKYINKDEFVFFSNYLSAKGEHIKHNNKVSLVFYWNLAHIQIRLEGSRSKLSDKRSDLHWNKRLDSKNALAIASKQSSKSISYEDVLNNYNNCIDNKDLSERPDYWGGYIINPIYFEFWKGDKNRINEREVFELDGFDWRNYLLQP